MSFERKKEDSCPSLNDSKYLKPDGTKDFAAWERDYNEWDRKVNGNTEDECDPEKIFDEIGESLTKLVDDIKHAFDNISFKIGVNFLVTIAIMLAALVGTTALAIVESIVLEAGANLVGSVLSAFNAGLAAIAGADLVMQYYQIRALKKQLEYRQELLMILNIEADNIIRFFQWYLGMAKTTKATFSGDVGLQKAIKYVEGARNIIISEANRISLEGKQTKTARKSTVNAARVQILDAIDALAGNYFKYSESAINVIESKYGLNTKHPKDSAIINVGKGAKMIVWTAYYSDLWEELKSKLFNYEAKYGTAEYRIEKQQKIELFMQILTELIPVLPPVIQVIILQQMFSNAAEILLEKIPVYSWMAALGNADKMIAKATKGQETVGKVISGGGKLNVIPDMKELRTTTNYEFFENEETKNLTLKSISTLVTLQESEILVFPSAWTDLLFLGSFQLKLLESEIDSLKTRLDELEDLSDLVGLSGDSVGEQAKVVYGKAQVAAKLVIDSNKLKVISGDVDKLDLGGGITTSGNDLSELTLAANAVLTELKRQIVANAWNPKTQSTRKAPVENAFNIAQKTLGSLSTDVFMLMKPVAVATMISNIQSIKMLWEAQLRQDNLELMVCNEYIRTMESNAAFMALKSKIDSLIDTLAKSKIGNYADKYYTGSLQAILDGLQAVEAVGALVEAQKCIDVSAAQKNNYMDTIGDAMQMNPFNLTIDQKKIKNIQQEAKDAINSLANKSDILKDKMKIIQDKLEEAEKRKSNITLPTEELDIPILPGLSEDYEELE